MNGNIRLAAVKHALERRLKEAVGGEIPVAYHDLADQCKAWQIGLHRDEAGQQVIAQKGLATFARLNYPKMPEARAEFMRYVDEAGQKPLPEPKPPVKAMPPPRGYRDPWTQIPYVLYDPKEFCEIYRGEKPYRPLGPYKGGE